MPATVFLEYAPIQNEILNTVAATGHAHLLELQIDQRSTARGLLAGKLVFEDNSELHFREFVDTTTQTDPRLMYVYHYQNAAQEMVFRYDNARHRPPLSCPAHKHTPTGVTAAIAPSLAEVIDEILTLH
jgi:hypothetical protein